MKNQIRRDDPDLDLLAHVQAVASRKVHRLRAAAREIIVAALGTVPQAADDRWLALRWLGPRGQK